MPRYVAIAHGQLGTWYASRQPGRITQDAKRAQRFGSLEAADAAAAALTILNTERLVFRPTEEVPA